ncbi:MAG: DUF2326 domain-containing protein [Fibrobacterota bacterium]|nr:MAG: DUF2326 domain-containing protein [Fibrobacterota bacterium]
MRKITSDIPGFREVPFSDGLNLVIGNRSREVSDVITSGHNVGKPSVLRIIEYALFAKRHNDYAPGWVLRYSGYNFTIQLEFRGKNITVETPITKRIYVNNPDHELIKNNTKLLNHFIRFKTDYIDEFSKPGSSKGKDLNWKPYIFGILGFSAEALENKLQSEIDYNAVDAVIKAIESADIKDSDRSEIIERLKLEAEEIRAGLAKFDFFQYEKSIFSTKITALSSGISSARIKITSRESDLQKVNESLALQKSSSFDIDEIQKIYAECGILFAENIKRNFADLVEFNRKLIVSRKSMLGSIQARLQLEIERLLPELQRLSQLRSKYNQILTKRDYKEEYEGLQSRLIEVEKELSVLTIAVFKKSKEEFVERKNVIEIQRAINANELRSELNSQNKKFEKINEVYKALTKSVLGIRATISVRENTNSNVNFSIEVKNEDIDMLTFKGDAFRRISCGLFDLSVAACTPNEPKFVAHDGILDGIEAPIKRRYLLATAYACRKYKIQYIISMINEGIPEVVKNRYISIELSDSPKSNCLFGEKF